MTTEATDMDRAELELRQAQAELARNHARLLASQAALNEAEIAKAK